MKKKIPFLAVLEFECGQQGDGAKVMGSYNIMIQSPFIHRALGFLAKTETLHADSSVLKVAFPHEKQHFHRNFGAGSTSDMKLHLSPGFLRRHL